VTLEYNQDGIQIYQADSLQQLGALADQGLQVDAVITDPPYSSGGQYRGDRAGQSAREKYQNSGTAVEYSEFAGDNRDQRAYGFWCSLWLSDCFRLCKPGSPVVLFTDWRQLATTTDALQAGGFVFRGIGAWDKTEGSRPVKGRFRNQCEFVVWGSKGPMETDGPCLPGVWRSPIKKSDKFHLTGKPTDVMLEICRIAWRPGSLILDPFCGSGTTLVAARELGLRAIGIESVAENIEICKQRLSQRPLSFNNPAAVLQAAFAGL